MSCGHPLCELIADGSCSIATGRSRGCRPGLYAANVAPEVFEEVRALLVQIDAGVKPAAIRLAEIFRREAREDRNLVAAARDDEPELAPALARLCTRRR